MLRFIPYHICFIIVLFFFFLDLEGKRVNSGFAFISFWLFSSLFSQKRNVALPYVLSLSLFFSPRIANKKSMSLRATQYTSSYYTVALSLIFSFSSTSMKSDSLPGKKGKCSILLLLLSAFFVVITTIMLFFFSALSFLTLTTVL